jgi:radical SAM superfamily enzyme YgiQ (UPF0313 family)
MNILLVNPPRFNSIPVIREERCEITERYSVLPPYSLLQIGSILRNQGNNVSLIDANGEDLSLDVLKQRMGAIEFSVLIFRFIPTTFDWDMKVTAIAKEIDPNIVTVGICWTLGSLAQDVLNVAKDLDIFIRHEYEVTTPSLISVLETNSTLLNVNGIAFRENGEIILTQEANPIDDYDALPMPAYDLLPNLKPYFINTPAGKPLTIIYTSKGCPYNCIYCTVARTKWKPRSAESVLNELRCLKKKYNIKTVSFFDETFTLDRKRIIQISKEMMEERIDITWYCNTRVNLVDRELLQIMKAGGCRGISYGIESGSQAILDRAKKRITVKQAENAIRWAKDAGIKVYCSFIFGLPGETWETIHETLHFVKKTLPTSAQFNVAVPYPGTELYDYARQKGYIIDLDWRQLYQHESILPSEALNTEELTLARKMAYRTLYFNPHWFAQNIQHILRNPEDFNLGIRYFLKIVNNYLIHGMKHAH